MNKRPPKIEYYLNIAREVARRSTCLRRHFGTIIIKEGQIIATGYTGAPWGAPNCIDKGLMILGLYEGVSQTKRWYYSQALPDKITIFKNSIERMAAQKTRLKKLLKIRFGTKSLIILEWTKEKSEKWKISEKT